ncbi:hypothetical protein B6I21_07120 [candidate division KSB1 bacterium 4572_119]|nr:MAG: hypothetical protein B6I21_07120 [candidate division KSB1 bacterium 4572_119]
MKSLIFKSACLILFFSFGFIFGSTPKVYQTSKTSTTEFATIDVLTVIYSNTAGKKVSPAEIENLKNGINLSREFIWRNSGCKLNLNISYLVIDEYKKKSFFPSDGLLKPEYIEPDLFANGITRNQYGIVIAIYAPPAGGGNYGGMKILGQSGYSFFRYPCRTSVIYPGKKSDINYKATWLFTHEIQHSIDLICYEGSNAPEMWHGDKPLDYSINAGEQFDYQAEIFRNFKNYLKIKSLWGHIQAAVDADNDHFPDHDNRVPIDEFRFGSDTTLADTDGDDLTDLEEFMAGIYKGSNPGSKDTDMDGMPDNLDKYPLNALHHQIPKITPQFESGWNSWYLVSQKMDFSSNFLLDIPLNTKIYLNWDEDFLYFGCELDAPAKVHLDIDLLNNGWWHGKDNYRIVIDPFSSRFSEIRVMDCTETARNFRESLNRGHYEMWDDDPKYVAKFGYILDELSLDLQTNVFEDRHIIKVKIPNNPKIPFKLQKDHQLGVRIYFDTPELGNHDSWATVYEQYRFFDLILR